MPGVDNVGAHVGRAVTGDQVVDVNSSEVWVEHRLGRRLRRDAGARSRTRSPACAASTATSSPTRRRRSATSARSTQGGNPVRGQRPRRADRLRTGRSSCASTARTSTSCAARRDKVRQAMSEVDGVVDPRIELPRTQPTLEIEVDLERAQRFGHQARRRAPRGGHAAAGPPGRQRLRGAEGLRRDRPGRARRRAAASTTCATC